VGQLLASAPSDVVLAAVPVFAYAGLVLRVGNTWPELGWRSASLRAAVVWGAYLVLLTEFLSLLEAIDVLWLVIGWLVPIVVTGAWFLKRKRTGAPLALPRLHLPSNIVIASVVAVVVIVTATVAWFAPPQTWDSLTYHMSRVAHWAQQSSVEPFATGIEIQNSHPSLAEFAILQTYVLSNGDRFANFVEWSAMIGSLIGVSFIASRLGASRRGQWLGVVFAATLPMGIVQASSTMNDYVVALWVVIVAAETLELMRHPARTEPVVVMSVAAALALATKPTSVPYILPFAAWVAILLFRARGAWRTLAWAGISLGIVILLSAGHYSRNIRIYGNPLNPAEVALHGDQPRSVKTFISNISRNVGLHLGTPSPHVNKVTALTILTLHDLIGADPNDPRTTSAGRFRISPPSTAENLASNPLHALIILVFLPLLFLKRRELSFELELYPVLALSGLLIFSIIFKWQIFASRYHLPFFILNASWVGYLVGQTRARIWGLLFSIGLLIAAIPWLFQIRSRPLVPRLGESYVGSILSEPRKRLYVANGLYLLDPYADITDWIHSRGCKSIGVAISGNGAEYPIWAFLGAPSKELSIGWVVAGTPSAAFADPEFEPCAIICEDCQTGRDRIAGLPRVLNRGGFQLFAEIDD
jgi:hypothetical protein